VKLLILTTKESLKALTLSKVKKFTHVNIYLC